MSKELEALKRIETTFSMNKQDKESVYRGYTNSIYPYYEDFDLVLKALQRLEAIDNTNPSEALRMLDQFINEMTRCLENPKEYTKGYEKQIFWKYKNTFETTIKQALLKAQEHNSTNIFKGSKEVKIEIPESSLMDYNPVKHYLKWEDLEFKEERQTIKVLLNGSYYLLEYYAVSEEEFVFIKATRTTIFNLLGKCSDDRQLFNDLHLERVEE